MIFCCFYCGSVGRTERSALKALREQLFAHKTDLLSAFQEYDKDNSGNTFWVFFLAEIFVLLCQLLNKCVESTDR